MSYNPFTVDIIVCPSRLSRVSFPYRSLQTNQITFIKDKPRREIVHFLLTVNNKTSYCLPYLEDKEVVQEWRRDGIALSYSLPQLEDRIKRLSDPQFDFTYLDEYSGRCYMNEGLKDKNPFEVEVIVCPTEPLMHCEYRDLDGNEQKLVCEDITKEIAHFVLTIGNCISYCVPFLISRFDGMWIRDNKSYESFMKRYESFMNRDEDIIDLDLFDRIEIEKFFPQHDYSKGPRIPNTHRKRTYDNNWIV